MLHEEVEVQKLFFAVMPAIILIELTLVVLSDTAISNDDAVSPDNEVAGSVSRASNSSATATITITMTGRLNE